eukprot:3318325-Prymnesium_polylepis.1
MSAAAGDLCVLEEPEHLNWYHLGHNWRRRFKLVVGIVHTNYISYARMYQPAGVALLRRINQGVCRAYCDRLIKLSDTLQARGTRRGRGARGRERRAERRERGECGAWAWAGRRAQRDTRIRR